MYKNLPTPKKRVKVLCVGLRSDDQELLKKRFQKTKFVFRFVCHVADAEKALSRRPYPAVVITEEKTGDEILWKEVLEAANEKSLVIVVARHPDTSLWAEVLNFGGHDVLYSRPFHPNEAYRSVILAWEHWVNHQPAP